MSSSDSDTAPRSAAASVSADGDLAFSLDNLSLLVEDIKDGFAAAMKQLSSIQHQDEEFQRRLSNTESTTQLKMEALQTAVNQMRDQFANVLVRVESLELHHRKLEGQVDRLDRERTEQQGKLESCQRAPVLERESAACQTPQIPTPYSCPTPLSPDSGRPGTCTPSCCHGNEFLPVCNDSHISAVRTDQSAAEKTLSMSRALAEQIIEQSTVRDSVDCEFDNEERQVDELSDCSNGCVIISGTTGVQQHTKQLTIQQLSEKRRRICQEIVDTERRYCSDLWTIIDLIAESLKSATFITMKDLCLIFPKCLPRLYDLHSTFLGLLETQLAASSDESDNEILFAGVFLDFLDANNGELFELYRRYANDFGAAVRTIRAYQQHSGRFRCLQHSLQRHPSCCGLDLIAFLLTPVQRLPRYLLLMRQLSVHTRQAHGDRQRLDRLLLRLHSLLDELNYSIQTALKEAQQQQQQQGWKRSRSLTRSSAAANSSGDWASGDEVASGGRSSGRWHRTKNADGAGHFMATNSRCRSATPTSSHQMQPNARCASGLPQFGGSHSALAAAQQRRQQQHCPRSPANMGPRSRLISRQLHSADRCLSASDILRGHASPSLSSSPAPSPAPSTTTSMASPLAADDRPLLRRTGRSSNASTVTLAAMSHLQQTAHKSTPTLKESFRRMFQSRRKSSLAKLESIQPSAVNCSDTFEDENGEPCTDV